MRAGHLEIETKFDVPLAYVVPELTGVEGVASVDDPVEHLLEALYFDTHDLRLADARTGVDLQLSGHTHGGTQLYVTPGVGSWGPPMRMGARPEVTVVELRSDWAGRVPPLHLNTATGSTDVPQASAEVWRASGVPALLPDRPGLGSDRAALSGEPGIGPRSPG